MNALVVLMGLLALSYLGGALVNKHGGASAIGLPASLEYMAVGFVLGPTLLNVVERNVFDTFAPLVQVALAWLTLLVGLEFGQAGGKNIQARVVLAAVLGAALTVALTGGGSFLLLTQLPRRFALEIPSRWILAAGLGVALCETTRHAVRWVMTKYRTDGPISDMLHGFAATSDIVPLGALGLLYAFTEHGSMTIARHELGPVERIGITLLLGALLGGVALVLVGKQARGHAVWGALFGTTLLGVGTAYRLGLSDLTVTFIEGLTIATLSPQRAALRSLLAPTERAIMLPTLLLAGTRLDFHAFGSHHILIVVVGYAILARFAAKWISGLMLTATSPEIRAVGSIGGGLLSAGALSIALGLTIALRYPGVVGDTVLVAATLSAVVGELIAPRALRRLLEHAGERDQARLSVTTVPPPVVEPHL